MMSNCRLTGRVCGLGEGEAKSPTTRAAREPWTAPEYFRKNQRNLLRSWSVNSETKLHISATAGMPRCSKFAFTVP
jgi:hypothetical protein